jgi:hypothetical protein
MLPIALVICVGWLLWAAQPGGEESVGATCDRQGVSEVDILRSRWEVRQLLRLLAMGESAGQ